MDPEREQRLVVAVFRAADDGVGTAAGLAALGFATVSLPVIAPQAIIAPAQSESYDAVLATSARAFLGPPPVATDAPLFVAGARTGRMAEAAGWRLSAPPAPDARQLAATVSERVVPGANLLYLAGRDRKPTLEAALASAYRIEAVEVYSAKARAMWTREESAALTSAVAALHYSRRSAALSVGLAERSGVAGHFRILRHICLSPDAAAPLEALGIWPVVASAPDEASLLRALAAALSHTCFD